MITIRHDTEVVATVATENDAFKWLTDHQPMSIFYALNSGGYSVYEDGKQIWLYVQP